MPKNVNHTSFEVMPVESPDGTLSSLTIQRTLRIERQSDNGRTLDYGATGPVGDPIQVPAEKVSDLVRELADWPMYYASGQATKDRKTGAAQGFSRSKEVVARAEQWNCTVAEAIERLVNSALSNERG